MKPVVILDNIRSLHNVGSIFRTSDAAGVSKLYLCGYTPTPDHNRFEHVQAKDSLDAMPDKHGRKSDLAKTALMGLHSVAWEHANSTLETVQHLKEQGYYIIALELAAESKPISAYRPTASDCHCEGVLARSNLSNTESPESFALIVGHERDGVNPEVLNLCDEIVHLPMQGKGISLNVSVAYGIAIYSLMGLV